MLRPPKYSYRAFGLNIGSEIPLPNLKITNAPPEVFVATGKLPSHLANLPPLEQRKKQVAPGEVLHKDAERSFYLKNGQEMRFGPDFGHQNSTKEQMKILEMAFLFLWLQRGALSLHASAVNINGTAVAFMGDGGSGKSTTSAFLLQQGFAKLADDFMVINFDDNQPYLIPFSLRQNLTRKSMQLLGLDFTTAEKLPGEEKYSLDISELSSDPVLLKKIYYLCPTKADEVTFRPLKGFAKINALTAHYQHKQFLTKTFPTQNYFWDHLATLGASISMTKIIRPHHKNTLTEIAAQVVAELPDVLKNVCL